MCGRYTLHTPPEQFREQFRIQRGLAVLEQLFSRYNIAPSQTVAAVRISPEDGLPELVALRWGLIPHWAKEAKTGYSLINARAESVASKPAFHAAFRRRRCLVIADGFFEWSSLPLGKGKQPWYITLRDGRPFAFAGLWERWKPPECESQPIESCTIIVADANELVRPIHDRMPVILDPTDYQTWLDPENQDATALTALLKPYPAEQTEATPVSRRVNSPKNDDPGCLEPLKENDSASEA